MCSMQLFWGDAHLNLLHESDMEVEKLERVFSEALTHLDFLMPAYYPAIMYRTDEGLPTETVGMRPEFPAAWRMLVEMCGDHNKPGELVCFPGYEWTGDRTRWGDVNVFYFDDGPLNLAPSLPELYEHLRGKRALVIPHHTAYREGQRGKDWSCHDPAMSPVTEIYSAHGSSEGPAAPLRLRRSTSMGPGVSGGTFQDALARGIKVGVIASSDKKHRFGGPWGAGLAGVWAKELTREAIWDAFLARRTYGVTGDRIEVEFTANGSPMGSEITAREAVEFAVRISASDAVDRVELIRDGRVIVTRSHRDSWPALPGGSPLRLKVRLEFGWGPSPARGFKPTERQWRIRVAPRRGRLLGAEGCFTLPGQRIEAVEPTGADIHLVTPTDGMAVPYTKIATPFAPAGGVTGNQAIVIEAELERDGGLSVQTDAFSVESGTQDLLAGSRVYADLDESGALIRRTFGYDPQRMENIDPIYYNAWKLKVHQAWPTDAYRVVCAFRDDPPGGVHSYYVRVSELNGQMAWTSPVWVTRV